jgi:protein-disulfide isomerase
MNNETTKGGSSSLPLVIIGLVLLAAVAGGFWFYSSSKTNNSGSSKPNANKNKPDEAALLAAYRNAPAGAQPANMLGSPTAAVTVEEFADYQCPTCAATHPKMKEINSIYGSRIKFIYRNFPLPMHKHGYEASVAAEAAGLQGKLWEMQNQLFTNQQAWSNAPDARSIFKEYAQKIGLDVDKFENDSLGLAAKQRVDADLERARALKVQGTPTIFVNGREIPVQQFDVTTMRQVIDAELQKAQSGSAPTAPGNQAAAPNNPATGAENANAGELKK